MYKFYYNHYNFHRSKTSTIGVNQFSVKYFPILSELELNRHDQDFGFGCLSFESLDPGIELLNFIFLISLFTIRAEAIVFRNVFNNAQTYKIVISHVTLFCFATVLINKYFKKTGARESHTERNYFTKIECLYKSRNLFDKTCI